MKRTINLDGNFTPIPYPEIEFKHFIFNGGEHNITLNNSIDYSSIDSVIITNRINSSEDLIKTLITKDALERKGIRDIALIMPYLPYARQDRVCNEGESFTLKVFCNLINQAKFSKVYVLDAHSDVAPALINNCVNISNDKHVLFMLKSIYTKSHMELHPILISPDSGANKKINKLAQWLNTYNHINVVKADKVRDAKTGNLTGFEVFANDLQNRDCIIVDDICDGGGTFIGLAKELKKKNAGKLYLFVTHGIFSKGFEELKEYFEMIYTTNSFRDIENNFIKQFKIQL